MSFARQTALIHRVHDLAIQQCAQSHHITGIRASICGGAVGEAVGLSHRDGDVLAQARVRAAPGPPLQDDFVWRIVADLEEAVRVVGLALEDPGRETAFEAAVADDVDGWGRGAARGAGGGGRGGFARVAGAGGADELAVGRTAGSDSGGEAGCGDVDGCGVGVAEGGQGRIQRGSGRGKKSSVAAGDSCQHIGLRLVRERDDCSFCVLGQMWVRPTYHEGMLLH